MKVELYKAIKAIEIKYLNEDDKDELINIFMGTKNVLIRNHIALIFAGLNYDKAVPYIIENINDKDTFNNNGTLVYALGDLDVKGHFISLIKIICEQEYEARLSAFGIIEDLVPSISDDVK
jgi:hypothetical protein